MNLKINKKQIPFIGDRNIDKPCYMTFLGMSLAFSCGFCFATASGIWTQACPGSTAGRYVAMVMVVTQIHHCECCVLGGTFWLEHHVQVLIARSGRV